MRLHAGTVRLGAAGVKVGEIDENLIRSDLTDLQRAQHTAKRAEVVKQRAELKAKLAPINSEPKKPGPVSKGQVKFIEDLANRLENMTGLVARLRPGSDAGAPPATRRNTAGRARRLDRKAGEFPAGIVNHLIAPVGRRIRECHQDRW